MEGSVLDQNKNAKEKAAPKAEESVLAKKSEPKTAPAKKEASVLSQKSEAKSSDGSVLGNSKPVTFYKKAWFWIIIAVLVLGGAGLGVFFGIRSAIIAENIEKFETNVKDAYNALDDFDSAFSTAYSDAGLSGSYYRSGDNKTAIEMRGKCLDKFGVNSDIYETIADDRYMSGEQASEKYGDGKVADLSKLYGESVDKLKDATKNISECETMMAERVKEDVEIEIGEFKAEKKGTYYTWYNTVLPVKVTNKADTPIKFRIEITAYDKDHNEIKKDYDYSYKLNSGKSDDLEFFTSISDSLIEKMQGATFEVTKISESSY